MEQNILFDRASLAKSYSSAEKFLRNETSSKLIYLFFHLVNYCFRHSKFNQIKSYQECVKTISIQITYWSNYKTIVPDSCRTILLQLSRFTCENVTTHEKETFTVVCVINILRVKLPLGNGYAYIKKTEELFLKTPDESIMLFNRTQKAAGIDYKISCLST